MQAKLRVGETKDLYTYWGDRLATHLAAQTSCIINLASKEYSLSISKHLPPAVRFITCVFGEEKDGKVIEKGTMCKMVRGEMVRFMARHRITQPEELRAFDGLGYRFDEAKSDDTTYVFILQKEESV